MITQILMTIFVIIAIVYIYRKYKNEDEDSFILKLIGYYLLGAFRFNFNSLAIPIGFIIYIFTFKPLKNKEAKKMAAYLGLILFISSLLIPNIKQAYFERKRYIKASSDNIYTLNLEKDFQNIKEKMGIEQKVKVEDFSIDFKSSGDIEHFRFMFLERKMNEIVLYHVEYSKDKKEYNIRPNKVEQWLQYDRLINEEKFLYAIKYLDIEEAIPSDEFNNYGVELLDWLQSWGVEDWDNFLITENGLEKIPNEQLPIEGYAFRVHGYEVIKVVGNEEIVDCPKDNYRERAFILRY